MTFLIAEVKEIVTVNTFVTLNNMPVLLCCFWFFFDAVIFLHLTNGDWMSFFPEYPACPGKPLFKESTVYYRHASPAEIPIHEGKNADCYS